jgi:hypothetical protein
VLHHMRSPGCGAHSSLATYRNGILFKETISRDEIQVEGICMVEQDWISSLAI